MSVAGRHRRSLVEGLLLGFSFLLPMTIAAAEALFIGAIIVWMVIERRRGLRNAVRNPYFWPVLGFLAVAGIGILWSVRPDISLGRAHRLLFPAGIFVVAATYRVDRGEGNTPLAASVIAFISGCAVRAVYDLVRVPWQVTHGVSLYDTGNMRDPQMYLASLCLLLAVTQCGASHRWRALSASAILVQGMGLILHFKRGVWIAFCLAVCTMGAWTRRWRMLAALALLVGSSLLVPQVRQRIALLREVSETSTGGRYAMWSEVAPVLLREYPQGMGWSAVTHEDLLPHAEYLQPGLNHLHNNLLQVALETGWLGLAAWILWMGVALWVMWRNARDTTDDLVACLSLGVMCAFIGLLANGMVEYNFGDTEILMLMCLLMGWSAAVAPRAQAGGGSNSPSSHANRSPGVANSPSS